MTHHDTDKKKVTKETEVKANEDGTQAVKESETHEVEDQDEEETATTSS